MRSQYLKLKIRQIVTKRKEQKCNWVNERWIRWERDNNDGDKKEKFTKKCAIERNLKFKEYKDWLKATQIKNKINQLEKKQS